MADDLDQTKKENADAPGAPANRSATGGLVLFGLFRRNAFLGVLIDRLFLGLVGLVVVLRFVAVFHALLEGLETFAEVTHEAGNLSTATEKDQDNGKDDKPMPNTERTHLFLPTCCRVFANFVF